MADSLVQLQSAPGIKRDGTRFEGNSYVDGQRVGFQRGATLGRRCVGPDLACADVDDVAGVVLAHRFRQPGIGHAPRLGRAVLDRRSLALDPDQVLD